jgi:trigger factor
MSSYFTSSGITKEDYLESQGMTEADYDSLRQSYGQSMAGQLLVMAAIEEAEGISTEDEEYQTSLEELIASAGVTEDVFFSYYSQFSVEQSLMLQRINEIIINNATVTETVASADDSAESSTAQETE